jgi:hypothetical protein
MIKAFIFISIAITIAFTAGCSSGVGQQNSIPEEIKLITDSYIAERTGEEFFNAYIELAGTGISADSQNYNLVYRFNIPGKDYINEEIRIITDMNGDIINIPVPGIPGCTKDASLCEFNIDEKEAKKIAEDNGLSRGKKGFKTDFTWQPEYERYVWKISSVIDESEGTHGYRGSGEVIIINPASGAVLDKSEWFVR